MERHDAPGAGEGIIAIGEGAEVYGSDGKHWGRVEAVGAHYLTIAAGLFGQKESYLPIHLVAHADADRIELALPLVDAQAQARREPPSDEPTITSGDAIPRQELEAVGISEPERPELGIDDEPPASRR